MICVAQCLLSGAMDSPEGRAAEVPPRGGDCNVGECGEKDSERINGPDGASACVEPLCFVGRHEKRCGQHFEGFGASAGSSWSFHPPSVGVEGSFVARSRGVSRLGLRYVGGVLGCTKCGGVATTQHTQSCDNGYFASVGAA